MMYIGITYTLGYHRRSDIKDIKKIDKSYWRNKCPFLSGR